MASPGIRHCVSCIGTLSFPIRDVTYVVNVFDEAVQRSRRAAALLTYRAGARACVRACVGTKYSCDECGKSFSLPQNLAIHASTHRDDHRAARHALACTTCHKKFASTPTLACCSLLLP